MKLDTKQRYGRWLFAAIATLVLAQVGWWTTVFFMNVTQIAELNRQLGIMSNAQIEEESFHRRLMFASESLTFAGLVCVALYLLYRALKSERMSRLTQRNFIETVSHESKTPLTALKLRLESIEERWPENIELKVELESAQSQVRRLSTLMEKALYLNRVERDVFEFEPILLAEAIEDVLKRMEPLLKERNVVVHRDLDKVCWIRADIFAIQMSIQSLIENAIVYNESAVKEVWLSLRTEGDKVIFNIFDNGSGISERDLPYVFDRFFRGRGNSRIPGSGLGLYLAKTIVEGHQGLLQILKPAKGKGAHFELRLPALREGIV